jgi:hexosaminidase
MACSTDADSLPSIVPLPRDATFGGTAFSVPPTVAVVANDADERNVAAFLSATLRSRGIGAPVLASADAAAVRLSDRAHDARLGSEGYRLIVDQHGVEIDANSGAGLFYGAQTFEQLLPVERPVTTIGGARIVDWPEYRWRGIHLDVSRHFFPVPVVERYIDVAARYKLNVFHWHLTDDQGWRFPVARYPLLTSVGGCRAGTQVGGEDSKVSDSRRYCGAYTAADIRAVVSYARKRYVTILPEIEMPGHSVEALAAYPWLGCGPGPYRVRELWGVSPQIFCPTERTFAFIADVLHEVATLFPGTYVHIGGDEVPKDAWEVSAAVAVLRRREHLNSLDDVQGYFTRRVERIAHGYGRRIVGWDEIMAGGVSRSATVMAWHGTDVGAAAARRGNDVVMTPDGTLYLDAYQGNPDFEPLAIGGLTTPEMIYRYDPMPPGLSRRQQTHVLGAQANLWTEYVPTTSHLFYMLLPRELALAELCWTPRRLMRWPDFARRLGPQLQRLERDGTDFRLPLVTFELDGRGVAFGEQQVVANTITLAVSGPTATVRVRELAPGATIHVTTDGSLPSARSPIYSAPLDLPMPVGQTVWVAAVAVLPDGRTSAPSFLALEQAVP